MAAPSQVDMTDNPMLFLRQAIEARMKAAISDPCYVLPQDEEIRLRPKEGSMPTSATKCMGITELFEKVVCELEPIEVTKLNAVCKFFLEKLRSSYPVQKMLLGHGISGTETSWLVDTENETIASDIPGRSYNFEVKPCRFNKLVLRHSAPGDTGVDPNTLNDFLLTSLSSPGHEMLGDIDRAMRMNTMLPGSFGSDYGIGVLIWKPQCLPTSIHPNHAIRGAYTTDPPTREVYLKSTQSYHGCLENDGYHLGRVLLVQDDEYFSRDQRQPCCYNPDTWLVRKQWGGGFLVVGDLIQGFNNHISGYGREWTGAIGYLLQVVAKGVVFPTEDQFELMEKAPDGVLDCSVYGLF